MYGSTKKRHPTKQGLSLLRGPVSWGDLRLSRTRPTTLVGLVRHYHPLRRGGLLIHVHHQLVDAVGQAGGRHYELVRAGQ